MADINKKQAIIYGLVNEVLTELMAKTNVENVVYSVAEDGTETYLSTKLASVIADVALKANAAEVNAALAGKAASQHTHEQSEINGLTDKLATLATTEAMNTAISTAISGLINGAPETYDTLKEIADYIASHEDVVDALNEAIGKKADKTTVEALQATVNALGAMAKKDKVSESDLDSELAAKVNAAAEGNHSHSNKTVLDGITAEKVSAWDAAEQNAKSYTDGKNSAMDTRVKALEAIDHDAYKDYADQAEADALSAAKTYADGLNGAMDTRVKAVEGKAHEHSNKTVLDGITAEKVSSWDAAKSGVDTLIGTDTGKSARTIANEELAKQLIPEGAQESLDTLAEIAAWIQSHPDDASAMNAAITALQNKLSGIDDGNGTVKKYVDDAITALKIGDYAKASELTALAGRVSTLEGKAHEHSNKAELDKIASGDVEKWNGKANIYVQAEQPAAMTANDLWIKIV